METINVRLLVSREGIETSIDASVSSKQSLMELNESYFSDVPSTATIKWIYFGRHLSDELPTSITPASVFHVYVPQFLLYEF